MLSTLSSFLPSVLSDKLDKLDKFESRADEFGNNQQTEPHTDDDGVRRRDMATDPNKKEKKKKSISSETFIVVRPPPAKTNHPLNLQLQLLPAQHSRDRSNTSAAATPTASRFSVDEPVPPTQAPPSPPESEQGLKRTSSNRSDTSTFYASSTAASTGSVTSFASTTSASSARRMIIPLYNLSAHNVMTNTVLDAGTDARVAKFLKRGLEIIDLAILEPTEVWCGKQRGHGAGVGAASDALGVPIRRTVSGTSSLVPPGHNGGQNGSRAATPDPAHSPGSSRLSLSSDHSSSAGHRQVSDPANTSATATPTGAKRLFGRMFRRKEGSIGGGLTPSASTSPNPAVASPPRNLTLLPEARTQVLPKNTVTDIVLPAVLGLSPTLSAASNPPSGRCVSYVWVIRKWLKTENQGLISGVLGKIGREASAHGLGHAGMAEHGDWEVRFEWSRGKSKGEKARKAKRRTSTEVGNNNRGQTSSRRNSAIVPLEDVLEPEQTNNAFAISVESPRRSLDTKKPLPRTPSPRRDIPKAVSVASTNQSDDEIGPGEDVAEDSEPEDSETPWTCSIILTQSPSSTSQGPAVFTKGHSRSRTVSSSQAIHNPVTPTPANIHSFISDSGHGPAPAPSPVKLKVATLSPAPHHPKVICQLKITFPLPDVEVEYGMLRKRLVLADGSTRSTLPSNRGPGPQPLTLTAEEIKDVVCSTAFWVVVREGFGGLGKKTRKGDGWKIRG